MLREVLRQRAQVLEGLRVEARESFDRARGKLVDFNRSCASQRLSMEERSLSATADVGTL
jgi:hypothetical protein